MNPRVPRDDEDLYNLLSLSVELAQTMKEARMELARERHPSASGSAPGVVLTHADRCDHCGQAAVYRIMKKPSLSLDLCLHSWRKNFPSMAVQGWAVIGGNPDLLQSLGQASE